MGPKGEPLKSEDERSAGDRLVDRVLGQLDAAEQAALDRELEASPELARREAVERDLNRALSRRLARVPAPPGLETRIRAALDEAASPVTSIPWYRRSAFAALAGAAVLAVVAIPFLLGEPAVGSIARFEALIVDLECDRAGKSLADQRGCRIEGHVNALRDAPEHHLTIGEDSDPALRARLAEREMRGHRVVVTGAATDDELRVDTMRDLGLDASIARAGLPLLIAAFSR